MFKLPVCPSCKSTYYYKDVRKTLTEKNVKCKYCKKEIRVLKTRGKIIIGTSVLLLSVLINIFIIKYLNVYSVIPLLICTSLLIIIGIAIYPYFVNFKPLDKK